MTKNQLIDICIKNNSFENNTGFEVIYATDDGARFFFNQNDAINNNAKTKIYRWEIEMRKQSLSYKISHVSKSSFLKTISRTILMIHKLPAMRITYIIAAILTIVAFVLMLIDVW